MATNETERVHVASLAVDSGRMLLGDPCYLDDFDYDRDVMGNFEDLLTAIPLSGNPECHRCLISATGIGDDVYPVYATLVDHPQWGRRVARLEIVFIDEAGDRESIARSDSSLRSE